MALNFALYGTNLLSPAFSHLQALCLLQGPYLLVALIYDVECARPHSSFKSFQWWSKHQKLSVKHEWPLFPAKIGFLKWDYCTMIYITSEADLCRIYVAIYGFLIRRKLSKIQQCLCTYIQLYFPNWIIGLALVPRQTVVDIICTHMY